MFSSIYDGYEDDFHAALDATLSHIGPAFLLAHLAGKGWRLTETAATGAGQVWGLYDGEELKASVMVPLSMKYADADRTLREAIDTVMRVEGWRVSINVSVALPEDLREPWK